MLPTLIKIDQPIRSSIKPVPHKVVQQPAPKELKKVLKFPLLGPIWAPDRVDESADTRLPL
ncbi:MAG: hypothetical protein DMF13_07235 [Verrucomicrobia bacterium]|nr:MAG: hypothetical protein DMF13_07235 [Verrucomicrobiota bacterium]